MSIDFCIDFLSGHKDGKRCEFLLNVIKQINKTQWSPCLLAFFFVPLSLAKMVGQFLLVPRRSTRSPCSLCGILMSCLWKLGRGAGGQSLSRKALESWCFFVFFKTNHWVPDLPLWVGLRGSRYKQTIRFGGLGAKTLYGFGRLFTCILGFGQ